MPDISERLTAALADRYRIERELGAGGMATVYLAHDVKHDRKVALKILKPELAAILGAERFLNEIKVTANLQHPNILPLYDSGEAEGQLYYVMPYVEGETLRDKLDREKQLSLEETQRITEAAAAALQYAHERGIVHRDIKPANILLQAGQALVADFGIALAVSQAGGTRLTETGLSLGTPHYMSPEQATGDRELDARSDIYSLGAVAYEMLTGDPPHLGSTAQAIIAQILTEDPRSVTAQRKTVPGHIDAAIGRALQKLPADRFASAAEFAAALSDPSFAATTAAAVGTGHGPARRLDWRTTLTVGAVVGVIAGGLAGWVLRGPPPSEPQTRIRFLYTPDSTHTVTSACCGPPLALSRDGRWLVYEGRARGIDRLYLREMGDLEARPLPGSEYGRNVFFSPGGEWVGFVADRKLKKVSVDGGAPVTIAELSRTPVGATWTDDNTIIFSLWQDGLFSVPADGGEPQQLVEIEDGAQEVYTLPEAIAGTPYVLLTVVNLAHAARFEVGLLSRETGSIKRLGRGARPTYVEAAARLVKVLESGALVSQPFDASRGDTTGPVGPVAEGIVVRNDGTAEYAVSSNGLLAFTGEDVDSPTPNRVDRAGGSEVLHFPIEEVRHFDNPRFAPDGQLIAAAVAQPPGAHYGYVLDPDRGTALRLTFDDNVEFLEWTAGGDSLIYSRGDRTFAIQPADRSGSERTVAQLDGWRISGRHTVHGRWIAFQGEADSDDPDSEVGVRSSQDIFTLDRESGETRPLIATPFEERSPAISPDGRWIAYSSDETGRHEVYVSSFPQAGARRAVSIDGGTEPVWGKDGEALYFRGGGGTLMEAKVQTGASFSVRQRDDLFAEDFDTSVNGADYDVAPSGEYFFMLGQRWAQRSLIFVVDGLSQAGRQ